MSNKRKAEIIKLLTSTIESEKNKSGGGNQKTISDLTKKLQMILDGKNKGIKSRASRK
jgi:hypothetical protein